MGCVYGYGLDQRGEDPKAKAVYGGQMGGQPMPRSHLGGILLRPPLKWYNRESRLLSTVFVPHQA